MEERPTLGEPEPTQDPLDPQVAPATTLATAAEEEKPETPKGETPEGEAKETPEEQRLPDGWRDTEEAKGLRSEGYADAQSQLEKAHQRSLKELKADHADQTQQTIRDTRAEAIVTNNLRAVEGFLSKVKDIDTGEAREELKQVLQQNPEYASIFSTQWKESVRKEGNALGVEEGLTSASRMLFNGLHKDLSESLTKFLEDVNLDMRAGEITRSDALGKLIGKRDELIREEESAKLQKLREDREGQEARASERDGQKPPVAVAGKSGDGGMSEDEELMNPETSITRIKQIVDRRKGVV